jgi:hypothetical protein
MAASWQQQATTSRFNGVAFFNGLRQSCASRLIVHPVFLAGGLPLFKEPVDLKLLSTRSFPAGAVALIYGRI